MLWKGRRQSDNVEDRRGVTGRRVAVGGGLGALAVTIIVLLLGGNPEEVMQNLQTPPASRPGADAGPDRRGKGAGRIRRRDPGRHRGRLEAASSSRRGWQYREPKLVLFTNATDSACGFAQSATGPFYCSGDEKVYIDLGFFQEMQQKLGARGDFAWAYVIAHEVGHHVQNLLGIMQQAQEKMQGLSQEEANRVMVRLELQADFLAGVWAHHAQRMKNLLEAGRHRGRAERRRRGGRRPHHEAAAGVRRPRRLHPRHVGAAGALVHPGLQDRGPAPGRHLRGAGAVGTRRARHLPKARI